MKHVRVLVPALTLLLPAVSRAQEPVEAKAPPPAAPAAPPRPAAVVKGLAKAAVHNQRVLAVLADDASDVAELKKDRALSRPLLYEFETVPLTGNDADAMAVQWGMPGAVQQKPALVVLAADGNVLARIPREDFVAGERIDGQKVLELLTPHVCAPVDANDKLAAGIATAKKTGRAVFVRFDAPW